VTIFLIGLFYNIIMKKIVITLSFIFIFLVVDASLIMLKKDNLDNEIRFIYISYLEYLESFQENSLKINKAKIAKIIDNIKYYNFNSILLHVSPFSDAIYNSSLLPYSYTLSKEEGKYPGFDYLEYFIKRAHAKKIKVHAWINPYRISSSNDVSKLNSKNPAINWLNTENIGISDKGIYYDPSSELVKELIINQAKELIKNYSIDGIHFDDYFYVDYDIDKYEYQLYLENGGKLSLKEFRLMHTNDLIKRIGELIEMMKPELIFSIAPDGNINNNYNYHYADVKTWINEEYIDIIMPQIYYGFNNQYLPFEKAYNIWNDLIKDTNVRMIPVLAYYKIGYEDKNAGSGNNEWLENGVIIKQISFLKGKDNYFGFGLFRYNYIFDKKITNDISKKELINIHKIL